MYILGVICFTSDFFEIEDKKQEHMEQHKISIYLLGLKLLCTLHMFYMCYYSML